MAINMNKQEISQIRKEFKDEAYKLSISNIFTGYGKANTKEILFSNVKGFYAFDFDEKEILYSNFKKALTGTLDTKLFELDFEESDFGNQQQRFLFSLKGNNNFEELSLELANNIMNQYVTDTDLVVTIASMSMQFSSKKDSEEDDEIETGMNFILCTINKIAQREKEFIIDSESQDVELSSGLEFIVNMKKPVEGFMYPILTDGYEDTNKLLYIAPKANVVNDTFAKEILGCKVKRTAKDEKDIFSNILKASLGKKIKTEFIKEVYEDLVKVGVENEDGNFSSKDIERILRDKGVDEQNVLQVEKVVSDKVGQTSLDFNIDNVIPKGSSKSVKIKTLDADVSISGSNLNKIKQVKKNGKVCLMIELNQGEEVEVEGFNLETE